MTKAVNLLLNDFLCLGLESSPWIISESPSFSKGRMEAKIPGQPSFYSNRLPQAFGFPAHWSTNERRWGRDVCSVCARLCEARQPPPAFLGQVLASHCLLSFHGKEVSFQFYLWPFDKGHTGRFLPLFHDWILLSSCFKKSQMPGSPIPTSTELSLLLLREADRECILKLEEALKVRLGTQHHS